MVSKVLLVDDDISLLNTLERNLSMELDIATAEGGQAALHKASTDGPFSVVVTDMQMPEMNGVQTIQALREKHKHLVYIMLTGNQDSATAIQAMNVGRVFRFLNKPCNIDEIKEAIDEAQREFDSKSSDSDLILNTMRGSINLLNDLASVHCDSLASAAEIEEIFTSILTAFNSDLKPEDRLLCRLLLVGASSLDDIDRKKLNSASVNSAAFHESFSKLCFASSKLIQHLPKFKKLAELLIATANATILSKVENGNLKPMAMRIAFYWSVLANRGASMDTVIDTLQAALPQVSRDEWSVIEVVHMATRS